MTITQILVFIVITGIGQLYFSHKRKKVFTQIEKDRKEMRHASKELRQINS